MKVRIKFAKQGAMKFIGHLDVMRYFQKAMRRAGVDIRYSEGFSPHQIMSFAAPLGVGLTSRGEYLDVELDSFSGSSDMVRRLNRVMAEGMEVRSCRLLADTAKNAMSIVAAADYTLTFRDGYEPSDRAAYDGKLLEFYGCPSLPFVKKTKKGEKEIDLKPMIYALRPEQDRIFMTLSAGSTDNLKPETVMEAFYRWMGEEYPKFAFMIQREEVYTDSGDSAQGRDARRLVPLEEMGEDIE